MKNTFGNAVTVTIFGESHGAAIGAVVDGLAAGIPVDNAYLAAQMDRRRARGDGLSTARTEADQIELLSGVYNGHTTGTPVTMVVRNTNTRSGDYAKTADLLRPGHADLTAYAKYGGWQDARGGGHFPAASPPRWWPPGPSAAACWRARGLSSPPICAAAAGWRTWSFPPTSRPCAVSSKS